VSRENSCAKFEVKKFITEVQGEASTLHQLFQIHGIKGFVIPTKSYVKIGITKIFCYNKMFSSINKTFGCCSIIFGCSNKKDIFFVPNFVAITNLFFREFIYQQILR